MTQPSPTEPNDTSVFSPRHRVAVVYKSLPQYRRRFFELLRERLAREGVEFVLIYGQPALADSTKKDTVDLPWARRVRNRPIRFAGRELIWQPVIGELRSVDLVIVEQASKLLVNYLLQARYWLGGPKFAFWGHGKNFQGQTASRTGEAIKRFLSRHVHWWFAYNETSAAVVREIGVPDDRITRVQNAIDTRELVRIKESVTPEQLAALRQLLDLVGRNVCIYAGGIYEEKRLPFMIDACKRVRAIVPDFEMIFVGAGVQADIVRDAAAANPWIKYVGPKFDADKVPYFMLSKLFLIPGLVGLAILDSFALEVPVVTTNIEYHSPEIEYLKDGENGIVIDDPDDVAGYAARVASLLGDQMTLGRLRSGCRVAREKHTVEDMVERFAVGVMHALSR